MPPNMTPSPKKPFNWARFSKNLSFWILVFLIPFALLQYSGSRGTPATELDYTTYRAQVDQGNVRSVQFESQGDQVVGQFVQPLRVAGEKREATSFLTRTPPGSTGEAEYLRIKGVHIAVQKATPSYGQYALTFLPYVVLIGFWIFFFRQMQAGSG
ncbi:MAG: ATP-dependent metallopeptidase FtsH/Yme1/Tma family protein, partial [Gemmatimonadaceae bacterium]